MRSLNKYEDRTVKLVRYFESLAEKRAPVAVISISGETVEYLDSVGINLLSVARDSRSEAYIVKMDLLEYHKYVSALCRVNGMHVSVTGEITTVDGIVIPPKPDKET